MKYQKHYHYRVRAALAQHPFGMLMSERTFSSPVYRYGFNGQEKDDEVAGTGNSYTAEFWQYDSRLGRRWNLDPLAHKFPWQSPYCTMGNNPILMVDPTGMSESPIYDKEGTLLGTDDEGLQGGAIVMDKKDFKQGMKHEDALKKDIGIDGISPKAMSKLTESYSSLPSRPDYDGYLTLDEANKWYREGNGQPLYTSLAKIDLSGIFSLGENYVGEEDYYNLLLNSNSLNDGLVYGSITLKRYPDHQVRAYADHYDFYSHNKWNPLNWPRNGEAYIGGKYAGKGQEYFINIYGSTKLTPILPWIK